MSTKPSVPKKKSKRQTGCTLIHSDDGRPSSFAEIVRHYKKNFQHDAGQLLRYYSRLKSIDEAIEMASFAKLPSGKRHPHQYRLRSRDLKKVHQRLKQYDLEACESFHELFQTMREAIADIPGIGELMIYDTSHRLGAYLDLKPEFVYVHAGVRTGAIALGFKGSQKWIDPRTLPRAFRQLSPEEIEDCLCIYKRALQRITAGQD